MKTKIKKREVVKIQYYLYCPVCNMELSAYSPKQVNWNIAEHLKNKHNQKKKVKNDGAKSN